MKFLILLSVVALCAVDCNGFLHKHFKKAGKASVPVETPVEVPVAAPAKSGHDLGALLKILAIPIGIKKQLLLSHQKKINARFDHYIGTLDKFSKHFDKATNGNAVAATDEFDLGGGGDLGLTAGGGGDLGLTTGIDSGITSGTDIGFNTGSGFDSGVTAVGTSGGNSAFESAEFNTGSTSGSVQVGGSVTGGGSFSGGASVGFGSESGFGGLSVGASSGTQDAVQLDIGHQSHQGCNHGYEIQAPVRVQTYETAPVRVQTYEPVAPSNTYGPPGYTPPAVIEPQVIQEVQQPPTITRDYLPPARRRYRLVRRH